MTLTRSGSGTGTAGVKDSLEALCGRCRTVRSCAERAVLPARFQAMRLRTIARANESASRPEDERAGPAGRHEGCRQARPRPGGVKRHRKEIRAARVFGPLLTGKRKRPAGPGAYAARRSATIGRCFLRPLKRRVTQPAVASAARVASGPGLSSLVAPAVVSRPDCGEPLSSVYHDVDPRQIRRSPRRRNRSIQRTEPQAIAPLTQSSVSRSPGLNERAVSVEDGAVLCLLQEEDSDHERHHRDHDRVPEARVDVPGLRDHRRREQRQHAAEPAVADVVGKGH